MTEQPKDGGAAFPRIAVMHNGNVEFAPWGGMSLRDWFAGQALASGAFSESTLTHLKDAENAYKWADAMIAYREATQ